MSKPNGFILWEGASLLDGAPIVAIATGTTRPSQNSKTGRMLQTWIMRRDLLPVDAVATGADASICGDCRHRGVGGNRRTCYVEVGRAPSSVFRAYQNGSYPRATAALALAGIGKGRKVRLGAYGDPAAVPSDVWAALLSEAAAWTGYTHQWRTCDSALSQWVMASVDSDSERREAITSGWRTFRVRGADDPLADSERVCPASDEAGKLTTCSACLACNGTARRRKASIAIVVHGAMARHFQSGV